jgi:Family of unknown function (DUF6152)
MSVSSIRRLLWLLAGVMTIAVANAHRSVANFDVDKTVTIEGTVDKLEWTNPHMWLWVSVQDKKGGTEVWAIEGASPANMSRRAGWSKRSVTPGDKVVVELHPFRDGRAGGALSKLTKGDGSVLASGGGGPTGGPGGVPPPGVPSAPRAAGY